MSPNQGSNADLASNTDLGINTDLDGRPRCWWCGNDPLYVRYHDTEWGLPVRNDQRIYEKICLEGFQAGLSWITILRKREAFRQRFANFDFTKVAHFNPQQVAKLVTDAAIIRHRKKIESAINNAQRAIEMVERCVQLFGRMPDGTTRIDECFVEISKICRRRADEAETEAHDAVRLNPDDANSWEFYGKVKRALGKEDEALFAEPVVGGEETVDLGGVNPEQQARIPG